jgi:3',5'-cyclic AMP phosphodiesterase CpdA
MKIRTLMKYPMLFLFMSTANAEDYQYRVAFMPDIHFHDVYGQFKDNSFKGLKNSKSGDNAVIRSMYAQLTSTRLFNENYFALRAALDDAGSKGIKLIALPGDFSDDGQPIHIRGLVKVLNEYQKKYNMRFFAAPGNHDPNRPFDMPSGEGDFLGIDGKTQRIFSRGAEECKGYKEESVTIKTDAELPTICSEEMVSSGYEYIMQMMGPFGMSPSPADLYWETPYSDYSPADYSFKKAKQASSFKERQYEICAQGVGGKYKKSDYTACMDVTDTSYLVEPTKGLWLLGIDANVYVPKENADLTNPASASNFSGSGDAGYNKMLTHKRQVIDWMASVAKRAKEQNKVLITFSHFPMTEFDNGAAKDIENIFGEGKFQLARAPKEDTSHALAKTGIRVHVGGHMHFNDTGVRKYPDGSLLYNIQAPSMAAYVPAYKILNFNNQSSIDVNTVVIKSVPRFDELFEHYSQEWSHLDKTKSPNIWNKDILSSKDYYEFTNWHLKELTRLRFVPEEWPCEIRQMLFSLRGDDMLVLSQIDSRTSFKDVMTVPIYSDNAICKASDNPKKINVSKIYLDKNLAVWQQAKAKASELAEKSGMKLDDFTKWNGLDLAIDFYRLRNADELALDDISVERLKEYKVLTETLAKSLPISPKSVTPDSDFEDIFRLRFGSIFSVINKYLSGTPSRNFHLDAKTGKIDRISD